MINTNKYTELLMYIIESIDGRKLGKTKLYKTIFFCDFESIKILGYKITEDKYLKYPMGPVPEKAWSIISQLIHNGHIEVETDVSNGMFMYIFKNKRKPDMTVFNSKEIQVIEETVRSCADKSKSELVNKSHEQPWKSAKDWDEIILTQDKIKHIPGIIPNENLVKDIINRFSEDIENLSKE